MTYTKPIETNRYQERHEYNPKIFALGGGRGLKQLLRALYKESPVAVSSVSDDGGDTGKCLYLFGLQIPSMGDIRRALAALSPSYIARYFEYKINGEDHLGSLNLERLTNMVFMQNGHKPEEISEIIKYLQEHVDVTKPLAVRENLKNESVNGRKYGNLFLSQLASLYPDFWPYIVKVILETNGSVFPPTLAPLELRVYIEDRIDGRNYFVESELDDYEGPSPRITRTKLVLRRNSPYKTIQPFKGAVDFLQGMEKGDKIIVAPGSQIASRWATLYPLREEISEAVHRGAELILLENAMHERRQTIGDGWRMNPEEMISMMLEPLTLPSGYEPVAIVPDISSLEKDSRWENIMQSYGREGSEPIEYPQSSDGARLVNATVLGIEDYSDEYGERWVIGHDPDKMKRLFEEQGF